MTKANVIERLDSFYRLFENALETKNTKELKDLAENVKVFEEFFVQNYVKRKKEGVYYTNEVIAKFIAKEVIYRHILTYPPNYEDLKDLEFSLKQKIHDSLLNISICDPACGSGIFLLSIAEYIFDILKILDISSNYSKLKFKIFKNLFGLDINKQAINLCRVRLFAWLFEDKIPFYDEILL
jgi:type I restriction-modification system DNA methylase subunit